MNLPTGSPPQEMLEVMHGHRSVQKLEEVSIHIPKKDTLSKGLGDTVEKAMKAFKLNRLAELYTVLTGKPCNCRTRQEALNKLMPYKNKEYKK